MLSSETLTALRTYIQQLQQLKKKLELVERCDALPQQQELLDAENDMEAAILKAQILEADIGNESINADCELRFKLHHG